MKKLLSIVILGFCVMFYSCEEVLELDLLDSPNAIAPENADLESLYNSVQFEFAEFVSAPQFFTMQLSRQRAFTAGNVYETAFSPINFDNIWNQAYSDFLPDANAVIDIATPTAQLQHVGTSKIMISYVLTTLVDLFGSVPFSSAGMGIDNLSPAAQSGEEVYAIARDLLTSGIADLEANTAAAPTIDVFYGGNSGNWIRAANSLLLRIAAATNDVAGFNAIIAADNFISDASSDFQIEYGASRANPDSRHPLYADHYEASDGAYLSNWFMWAMNDSKETVDPRIRGYFYRQVPSIPLDNINRFDCINSVLPDPEQTPQHYLNCNPEMPYCVGSLTDGYYGRDHANGNGIPPDGDIRTRYGVYPVGGKFDNESFIQTQNLGIDGALGQGIHPLMPSSFVNFYRAEMAAKSGDDAVAREQLLAGVEASISKVVNFIQRDTRSLEEVVAEDLETGEVILGAAFLPADESVQAYVTEVGEIFDAASDKLDVIATEFLLASFGNGLEGYNLIRRTARPSNLQPAILTSAGTFIRSALLPATHVNLNQSATQKSVFDQVFWDTNPANLGPCFN
jgi:hypothetical protein